MTKTIFKTLVLVALSAIPLCACAPTPRFEWGSYEASLYTYYKSPDQRAQYKASLVSAIALGTKEGRVAPGLCAELGYIEMEDGNSAQAEKDFEEEMQLFPESKPFLTGVMRRMSPSGEKAKGATS